MPRHPFLSFEQKSKPKSSSWLPGLSPSCSPFPPWSYLGRGNSPTVRCSAGPCGLMTPTGLRTWPLWPFWCTSSLWQLSGKKPASQTHTGLSWLGSSFSPPLQGTHCSWVLGGTGQATRFYLKLPSAELKSSREEGGRRRRELTFSECALGGGHAKWLIREITTNVPILWMIKLKLREMTYLTSHRI